MQSLLLKAREAALLLQVSEKTLWTLTKQGHVAVVRIGNSVRYSRSELDAFIKRHSSISNPNVDIDK